MASGLILIDIQQAFGDPYAEGSHPYWGRRNNPDAEANAARLLECWRSSAAPIFHVRHLSTSAGSPLVGDGAAIKAEVAPQGDEPVYEKTVNSAFIGTELEHDLTHSSIGDVVICGLTTPHCISTSVRMAANLGFGVRLAHDACAAFTQNENVDWAPGVTTSDPKAIHDAAISVLHGEFCRAMSTDAILKEGP